MPLAAYDHGPPEPINGVPTFSTRCRACASNRKTGLRTTARRPQPRAACSHAGGAMAPGGIVAWLAIGSAARKGTY